jgi:hypothetical protein
MYSETRRVAQCECHVCHSIVPKTYAVQREVEKKSGRIGWGWSASTSSDGSNGRRGVSSGRDVYRNTSFWVCLDCVEDGRVTNRLVYPLLVVVAAIVAVAIGWWQVGIIAVAMFLLTSTFGQILTCVTVFCAVLVFPAWRAYDDHFYGPADDHGE